MDYPGEKLVIRMWDTVAEKGIGALLRPWQIRREGRASAEARREETLLLAQAERDAEEIRTGLKTLDKEGNLIALPPPEGSEGDPLPDLLPTMSEMAGNVERALVADTMRREVNVGKSLLYAEETLEAEVAPEPEGVPGDDWLFRWRDGAGEVSEPELQRLWGALLAGEFSSPGKYSLRTMDFLRNLSHTEAKAIAKLAPFVAQNMIYRGAKEILEEEGLGMGFLLSMQSLGILSGVESLGLTATFGSSMPDRFEALIFCNTKVLVARHPDPERDLTIKGYPVTTLGSQIISLGRFEPHLPYVTNLAEDFCDQGFDVEMGDWRPAEAGKIEADLEDVCSSPKDREEDSAPAESE